METNTEDKTYKLQDLSESSAQRAYEQWRENAGSYDWWSFTFESFRVFCELVGISLDSDRQDKPSINFDVSGSQGEGACFTGTYSYYKGSAKAVAKELPGDVFAPLREIAVRLQNLQRKYSYQLYTTVKSIDSHHAHEHTVSIRTYFEKYHPYDEPSEQVADEVAEALRDAMRWLYGQLKSEYEYITSREAFAESAEANQYTFTEAGRFA